MIVAPQIRESFTALMAEYAMAIDEDRLEDWVELFDERCDYRVVTRENVEQGLPNVLMWCDNKDMLRDRVESYREVNEYNLHYDRHVLGPLVFKGNKNSAWSFDVAYSLFQTTLEGESRLFSVGRYAVEAILENDKARLKSVTVIADTGLIPSLLATPI
jgi:anthranilate 1,2-dioxygenase small subunit